MFPSKAAKRAPVTIFEDVAEDEDLVVAERLPNAQGKTLLSKPARKPVMTAAVAAGSGIEQRASGLMEVGQSRSRLSLAKDARIGSGQVGRVGGTEVVSGEDRVEVGGVLKKEARRRTIFMPSDDTTMLTIHPGAHASNRLEDTFQLSRTTNITQQEPMETKQKDISKPGRRPRKSLAVAPRRIPLQQSFEDLNKQIEPWDVCGDNTGKENLPPMAEKMLDLKPFVGVSRPDAARAGSRPSIYQPTAASLRRQPTVSRTAVPITAPVAPRVTSTTVSSRVTAMPPLRDTNVNRSQAAASKPRTIILGYSGRKTNVGKEEAMRRLEREVVKLCLYPVLSEDLAQPELYENSWLRQQEVALTEVVNGIFASTDALAKASSVSAMRKAFVDVYHRAEVTMLHKRLQASLLYGALSKPKTATFLRDLSRDIGLRKRFMTLWLDSYNEDALRTAAEIVVGRQVPRSSPSGSAKGISEAENVLDRLSGRRALTKFLETFFAAPVDIDASEAQFSTSAETVRWRKTMLRSLMLVWLLDEAKVTGIVTGCLYKRSAVAKSSTAVLHELSGMLMPSVGDITRALKQMDYEVHHVQDPLDEVKYHVENLAVGLRDGVLLAHLVEVLLYSNKSVKKVPDDVTITMPDTTTLTSQYWTSGVLRNNRMLSQHLKMPAIGHAQKTFNVQLALSALECHDVRAANVVGDITADDIVSGHREKSLSLLWSLVTVFGLTHLIDCKALAADVQRKAGGACNQAQLSIDEPEMLLQEWAAAYANRSEVNKVTNLTTSFADGQAYAAIIDGFSTYMPAGVTTKRSSGDGNATLEARLESLGCSKAFTTQLASTVGNIPSRETTISNLAFLASRLLPLAGIHHAAATIQRAFRQKRARTVASQRIALMRMARDCATVVQTGQRIDAAATTIQRAWRAVLDARLRKMSNDITRFQTMARGWSARRIARGSGAVAPQRVMCGW